MKNIIKYCLAVSALCLINLKGTVTKMDADPLHKRAFNISLVEIKNGIVAKKPLADIIYFKNGRLHSDFLQSKFGYKNIKYRINKDSIFNDFTDTEVRWLDVEAIVTDEKNQTLYVEFTVSEWDIDGQIRFTKNDKLKRTYDLVGREKGGKPKKKSNSEAQEKNINL